MFNCLNQRHLNSIESVHRGFLYQHLYAVGCLLLSGHNKIRSVLVELDEDVELEMENGEHIYIQIKTRTSSLILGDIQSALNRFQKIRIEHEEKRRSGTPSFLIIANVAPSGQLREMIENNAMPSDVKLLWPAANISIPKYLPPSWSNLSEAIIWCVDQARTLPMAMLEPETLIWKLAGRVSLAATGTSSHIFNVVDLSSMFEQLVVQLQKFPNPPEIYRPQESEPSLISKNRVRLISGFSGAGKTTWAAYASTHLGSNCAYYDVGDISGPAIASSLVRELAAQWAAPSTGGLRQILLPGISGIESLRALDVFLETNSISALVVLDNAHRIPVCDLRMIIETTHYLQFVFLVQPSDSIVELETIFGIKNEVLNGWSLDQIAAEVQTHGAHASVSDLARLLGITGSLPLYVRSAVKLSIDQYDGDIAAMCMSLESHSNIVETAQEVILHRSFNILSKKARDCVAVMSLCDVSLTSEEAAKLVKATFNIDATGFAGVIKQLRPLGVVRIYGTNRLQIHDAFRIIGLRHFAELSKNRIKAGYRALKDILIESFQKHRDISRISLFIRVLVKLEEFGTLIEIATEEWFHELGISSGIWETLESAMSNERMDAEQRFYALDGLIFSELKISNLDKVEKRLQIMEMLINRHNLDNHAKLVFLLKRMTFEAQRGNKALTMQFIEKAKALASSTMEHQRILNYNIASALYMLKNYIEVESMLDKLVIEYYDVLKLTIHDVVGKSNIKIAQKLHQTPTLQDDLKHLADALNLLAQTINAQGRDAYLNRIHAAKFYGLANALNSFISVNQDLVDEFIYRFDYLGAKKIIEEYLLPVVINHKMLDKIISTRSQYAVVLAYCGEYDAAETELNRLNLFQPGLTESQIIEIGNQRALVNELRLNKIRHKESEYKM